MVISLHVIPDVMVISLHVIPDVMVISLHAIPDVIVVSWSHIIFQGILFLISVIAK